MGQYDQAWRAARENLSRGIAYLQARQVLTEAMGSSLGSAIDEALARLDSAQGDEIRSVGEDDAPVYLDTTSGVGLGELQRIQRLRDILLGDEGLLAKLRELEAPE
jgi:hypothetical protein